jgi:hypothetical protein
MQQSGQKRGKIGLLNTSLQKRLRSSKVADFVSQGVHQLGLSIWTAVGQSALKVIPYSFIRVQLWGVRRKRHQVQTGRVGEKLLHRVAPMSLAIVQQSDQMTPYLTQQMAKEYCHFLPLNIILVELAVQCTMEAFRADGDTRDGRDPVMAFPVVEDRCLSHRTPGLTNRRDQEEARFVDKDEVGFQPCGVFFTRGQTERFHSAMAASLRSKARRSGFWWLQPIWWRSLPT